MKKNRLALGSLVVAVAGLAACSDSPVTPLIHTPVLTRPGFVLLQPNPPAGTISVCSAVAAATFNVSFNNAEGVRQIPPLVGAGPTYTLSVGAGACATIWLKAGPTNTPVDPLTIATVTQTGQAPGFHFDQVEAVGEPGTGVNQGTQTATLAANAFHGASATFTQEADPVEEVCDRYTFGGWVNEKPNHTSYGVNAGLNSAGLAWGDFEVNNHANGDQIHVWNVTAYGIPLSGPLAGVPNARFASGPAEVNGEAGHTAEFRFVDNGEPGSNDQIWLAVDGNQYFPLQTVKGGNIQLHDQCKKAPKDEKH